MSPCIVALLVGCLANPEASERPSPDAARTPVADGASAARGAAADFDGDGVLNKEDCAPEDPGAATMRAWWLDADGDGYGDRAARRVSCGHPWGYVDNLFDCDDTRADVYPGGTEVCDGADQDCNGWVDDDPLDPPAWYADADGDGYAGSLPRIHACTGSGVFTFSEASDCDDVDPAVSPAAIETCADGLDQNCNGVDDCTTDVSAAALSGHSATSDVGTWVGLIPSITGSGSSDLLVASPQDSYFVGRGYRHGGAFMIVGADVRGSGYATDLADVVIAGADQGIMLGRGGVAGCDVNGDGAGDVLAGAYVHWGPPAVALWISPNLYGGMGIADVRLLEDSRVTNAFAVACDGDAGGDGSPDIVVGAVVLATGGDRSGTVYLFDSVPSGAVALSTADSIWEGTDIRGDAGASVGMAADLSGDGIDDLWMGAPRAADGGSAQAGVMYIEYGPVPGGRFSLADADSRWVGARDGDRAGTVAAAVGDTDNDGLDELLIGSRADQAFLLRAPTAGTHALSDADVVFQGAPGSDFGQGVAGGLDIDGDGTPEVAVGAPFESAGGAVFLFDVPASGRVTTADALVEVTGALSGGQFGHSVVMVPDTDEDGRAEIFVGAPGENHGVAYLFLGGDVLP